MTIRHRLLSVRVVLVFFGIVSFPSVHSEQTTNSAKEQLAVSIHQENKSNNPENPLPQLVAPAPSAETKPLQPDGTGSAHDKDTKPEKNWLYELQTDPIATFTSLLFLATVFLWWATRSLVKGAERTSEMQLRAYLHVKRAGASRDSDGVLWAKVEIQNYGQTPAYDVVQWIGIVGVSESDKPNISRPADDFKKAKGIMAPGNHTEFLIPTHDRLTPEKEAALSAGKATIYVFGEITYRDIFKNLRKTKFKMFLSGEGATEGRFKNCEEGNEAT